MPAVLVRCTTILAILGLFTTPALADAGEWYDYYNASHGGSAGLPSTGDSEATCNEKYGLLHVRSDIVGVAGSAADYWASAKVGRSFLYGGSTGDSVYVKVQCDIQGFMDLESPSQAHNYFDLRVEILDLDAGEMLIVTEHFPVDQSSDYPREDEDVNYPYRTPQNHEFYTTALEHDRNYAVALVAEVRTSCDSLDSGTSEVDFHSDGEDGYVDLELLEYWWDSTYTDHGDQSSTPQVAFFKQWTQSYCETADELRFDLHDDKYTITAWRVDFTDFPNSSSYYTDDTNKNVYVEATNGIVHRQSTVSVRGKVWGVHCGNHFEVRNKQWHPVEAASAVRLPQVQNRDGELAPEYYWDFSPPYEDPQSPGDWLHRLTIKNVEDPGGGALKLRGLMLFPTYTEYEDLTAAEFGEGFPAFVADLDLGPQMSYVEEIPTGFDPMVNGFIYLRYKLLNAASDTVICNAWGGHLIGDPSLAVGSELSDLGNSVKFALLQNTPNPFSPRTVIRYDAPRGAGRVTLRIYDLSGRLLHTLVDGVPASGRNTATWNGRDEDGQRVAAGVYFYRLTAPGFDESRRMVLLQ